MTTATLIRDYARQQIRDNYGSDERPAAILVAIDEAQTDIEVCFLGQALLARHDALADVGYRIGEPNCEAALMRIYRALS